ncbi:MAG: RluA family pseudouridine synthase [Candidatus Hydrogenedentota bacterium]
MSRNTFEGVAGPHEAGLRLDVFLAGQVEDASRSYLQKLIKQGNVAVNGAPALRPSRTVAGGDAVRVTLPPPPTIELEPEPIPLDRLHEDVDVVVVNKQAGLVVHPAPGNERGTLVNALLHHCPDFARPGGDPIRPGIVHRLDKDTSGVMVVAKSQRAFLSLSQQAREHTFDRRYLALTEGNFKEDRLRIEAPVGRSLSDRTRMSVTGVEGRDAVTHVEVLERFRIATLVAVTLETGRTHQIRVHLRYSGHPVLGDPVYGVADFRKWPGGSESRKALEALRGQALHAERLGFRHPTEGERMEFTAPPSEDFQAVLKALRNETEMT